PCRKEMPFHSVVPDCQDLALSMEAGALPRRAASVLAALRRCVYADADFVLGHVTLADLHSRQGQKERARKSLETVGRLLAGRQRQELVPEGDGLTVGRLLEVVRVRQQQA